MNHDQEFEMQMRGVTFLGERPRLTDTTHRHINITNYDMSLKFIKHTLI